MKVSRYWLALSYLLATLLAEGVHHHDGGGSSSFLESRGDCDETRPHVADHEVDGPLGPPTLCPSCQFRGQPSLNAPAPRPIAGLGVAIPPEVEAPSALPGSPLRTRCRAPPLA